MNADARVFRNTGGAARLDPVRRRSVVHQGRDLVLEVLDHDLCGSNISFELRDCSKPVDDPGLAEEDLESVEIIHAPAFQLCRIAREKADSMLAESTVSVRARAGEPETLRGLACDELVDSVSGTGAD
jgi:hypothetical protein